MNKTLVITVAIVAVVIVLCAFFWAKNKQQPKKNEMAEMPYLSNLDKIVEDEIKRHNELSKEFFDSIFSSKFFSRDYNPFEEIERFDKEIMKLLNEREKKIFSESFNKWFNERVDAADMGIKNYETEKEYVMELSIPDAKEKNISIEIKKDYLKVSSKKSISKEEKKKGSEFKSASYESIEKYIKLPEKLSGKDYTTEISGDKVIIKFKK